MFERAKRRIIDRLGVNRVAAHADRLDGELGHLLAGHDQLRAEVEVLRRRVDELEHGSTWSRVRLASAWAASAPLLHQPTISVVMPTRDRSHTLGRAIESVVAQTYPNWQLVVVDDGSTDDTASVLSAIDDHRVLVERTAGIGAAAARNHGLGVASGDFVAFLDDDNVMDPGWLRAVAEYTGRHRECAFLYGAQIRESESGEAHLHVGLSGLHLLYVDPFDSQRLRENNYIDLGVVAVRRDHPELRFDEHLEIFIDWEMIVRLARSDAPHPLPVLASLYSTGASGRITTRPDREERLHELRARFAAEA